MNPRVFFAMIALVPCCARAANLLIATDPQSVTVALGEKATLNVDASISVRQGAEWTGAGVQISYEWSKDGSALSGHTTSRLVINSVQETDIGHYTVRVTQSKTNLNSSSESAEADVRQKVAITTQPLPQVVLLGQPATFSVVASGTAPKYEWKKDGQVIRGETQSQLTVAIVGAANLGDYEVEITNSVSLTYGKRNSESLVDNVPYTTGNTVTSLAVALRQGVTISQQPTRQSVLPGASATFSVNATGGTVTYQWRKDGVSLEGKTDTTLTIESAQLADYGDYDVVISNLATSVTSDPATLSILARVMTLTTSGTFADKSQDKAAQPFTDFGKPAGVAVAGDGTLYVSDETNHVIWKVVPGSRPEIYAGVAATPGNVDGYVKNPNPPTGTTIALFNSPKGIAIDHRGAIYVADMGNSTIRRMSQWVETIVGKYRPGTTDAPRVPYPLISPVGVTAYQGRELKDQVYIADRDAKMVGWFDLIDQHLLMRLDPVPAKRYGAPSSIAIVGTADTPDIIYICDSSNQVIWKNYWVGTPRRPKQTQRVEVLAGAIGVTGTSDSPDGTKARFNTPHALALDSKGTLFVSDYVNNVIRKVTPAGSVTTYAGQMAVAGLVDGSALKANLCQPDGLAVDSSDNLFVADGYNSMIRRISPERVGIGPVIRAQPKNETVSRGKSVTFSVTATGSPSPTYQWRKNDQPLSGETSATLTLAGTTESAGKYDVIIRNGTGTTTSNVAILTVN